MNANERPNRRRSEEGRKGGAEVGRPSVRPSTSLNGRRTCGRAGGRRDGRTEKRATKYEVRSREPIWHTAARPSASVGRRQRTNRRCRPPARPPCSFLPAILPAWLIWAALSLTHCMVALDGAVAAAAALSLPLSLLPPLHGHPAAVVVTPRRGRPLRQDGRRRLRPLEERRGQAGWHRLPAGRSDGGGGGSRGCHFTFYSS